MTFVEVICVRFGVKLRQVTLVWWVGGPLVVSYSCILTDFCWGLGLLRSLNMRREEFLTYFFQDKLSIYA